MSNGASETTEIERADPIWDLPGIVDETPAFEDLQLRFNFARLNWADLEAIQDLDADPRARQHENMDRINRVLDAVVDGGAEAVMPLYRPRIFAAIMQRAAEITSPKDRSGSPPMPTTEAAVEPHVPS